MESGSAEFQASLLLSGDIDLNLWWKARREEDGRPSATDRGLGIRNGDRYKDLPYRHTSPEQFLGKFGNDCHIAL